MMSSHIIERLRAENERLRSQLQVAISSERVVEIVAAYEVVLSRLAKAQAELSDMRNALSAAAVVDDIRRELQVPDGRSVVEVATERMGEIRELRGMLNKICEMQADNFGNGMATHLDLIGLCDTARKIVATTPGPATTTNVTKTDKGVTLIPIDPEIQRDIDRALSGPTTNEVT